MNLIRWAFNALAVAAILGMVVDAIRQRRRRRRWDQYVDTALAALTPDALPDAPTPTADAIEAWLAAGAPPRRRRIIRIRKEI